MAKRNFAATETPGETSSESAAIVNNAPNTAVAPAAVIAPEASNELSKRIAKKSEVRAKVHFADALTGKNFRAGDIVTGWDEARAAHYAERGLVVVHNVVGPSEFK